MGGIPGSCWGGCRKARCWQPEKGDSAAKPEEFVPFGSQPGVHAASEICSLTPPREE